MSGRVPKHLRQPHPTHTHWLLRRVWNLLHEKNEHFVGCIVGREGIGKSHTAITIASALDDGFTADRVLFSTEPLLETLRDRDHQRGDFYILDEAGVQLGNRTWQERSQILVNQALQLIRNHNLGLLLTLPRLGELDSQAQGRLHAFFEILEKVDGDHVRGKWKYLDPDRTDMTGEVYHHKPRRRINGQTVTIESLAFGPPDDSLVAAYEERKEAFQSDFYDKVLDELQDSEEGETGDSRDVDAIAEEIKAEGDVAEYLSHHGGWNRWQLDTDLLRDAYDLSHSEARLLKKKLKADSAIDIEEAAAQREAKV